jgi:hypothetical protein
MRPRAFYKALDGFRIRLFKWELEFDHQYGFDKGATGWSVNLDGHYLVQLEPWLLKAIWKARKEAKTMERRSIE